MTAPLSPAERRVANHLAAGRTNREIAAALLLAEETVKSHVKAILRKLAVPDRTAAAVLIREADDRDAAVALIRVAAEHYRASRLACARILAAAHAHGLHIEQLAATSGLPAQAVDHLVKEAG